MTIKLPKENIFDRILKVMGKKRGYKIPWEAYEKLGPYVYAIAEKESFWKALFRPKNKELPEGYLNMYSFLDD
ncbi:MAG: hypothetical protein V3S16_08685 [Candidatus Desulfatibia sp.]|uniref:hypothetical protein n=1 Tax=Candidatus Desulfatibia sp. TaxID=3101189 RepID=UPI002F30AC96